MIKIGIDAMGGDFAPEVAIEGAIMSLKYLDKDSRIVLFGDQNRIVELLKKHNCAVDNFDIVATTPDGNYHFVEVKTRKMGAVVGPTDAITPRKVRNLVSAANHFIQAHAIDTEAFIDLVTVEVDAPSGEYHVELIPDIANCRW